MEIQLNHLHTFSSSHPKQPPYATYPHHRTTTVKVHSVSGNAQKLIQSGTVVAILPKEAVAAIDDGGYKLLDIRPEWEREKSRVKGSMHVPLFVQDMDNGPITLLKKWVHFGYIGLWTGQYFTMINPDFVDQVEKMVPDKSTKLLVACGEGLRSMMATSKLHKNGYINLGWLAGGFNRAIDGDFPEVEGPEKLQYATIGGVSYYFLKLLLLLQAVGKNN
ncbi:hypothetical protein E3N88_33547 [Mikania micrantha]|uniref:Rhodanese domain-containing protein n=1 Tax=Mikania micrantha TaxID=192012 RepID=A0A5N6MC92_9ASTR|nr:hypothetical protein E3N88_33547 [Mikania micrantha]